MILWCDGDHDPVENMGRDRALLERAERAIPGRSAVLRLFRFAPSGITLGHAQRPERALDLDACRRDGVSWAVRPTGGRAIFHAEEWTYSFTAAIDDPRWGGNLHQAYAAVSGLVLRSLLRLGVPVRPAGPRTTRAPAADAAAACFAATGHHEIELGGGKLVGSAQRRLARAFLQQGSLLLGEGHLRLADYLPLAAPARERVRAALRERSVSARRWLGSAPLERWAAALETELGGEARVVRGEEGLEALTLPKAGSYTAAPPDPTRSRA